MGNQSAKQHHQISGGKPKKFVHWKSAERPSPPGRPILIPVADQEIDVITLKWDRPRTDGGSPIIGYIIEQHRMGSSHWVRATPSLVPVTEVAISGLEPGWRYQFRAIAENVVGKSDPSELSDPLTVTLQRNAITVPRFIKELVDTIVIENERVEMKVAVLGQPPPEINWFKDGFEIFSSRRTKIVNDNETSVLIIHQCAFTDEGEIKCTATNRAGHVATKANLKVVAPPKIRLPRQYEDGLIVEAGEMLRLKVGLAGQPPPVVVWSHEGEIINNTDRYELVTNEKNSSLKIENVKRSDRGEYILRASNNLGEDIASFLVTVTSKPNPPGKIQFTMSFGRSVTLSWTAPDDDGGCKIGNYIVEYFRVGWNVWLKASTTRKLSTTLHDLIEGSEYKFRVKAENPYGVSEPSADSDVLFIPDLKRGIMEPVREHGIEDIPPIPPKRRALSPIKNFLGVGKKSSRSPSPNNRGSPSLNVQLIPEIFENETLRREMSYGTPNDVLNPKEARRYVSFKDDTDSNENKTQKPIQKAKKVSEGTQSLNLQKIERTNPENQNNNKRNDNPKLTVNQKFQNFLNRSPSPARRKMSLPAELLKLPTEEENDKTSSPKLLERRDSLILEKVHQFFKRSPTPSRKNIESSENKTDSLETISTEQPQQQQRKDSLIIEKVQNLFRRSPSPARKIISQELNVLLVDIKLENHNTSSTVEQPLENIRSSILPQTNFSQIDNNKALIPNKNISNSKDVSSGVLTNQDGTSVVKIANEMQSEDQVYHQPFGLNPTIKISMPGNEPQVLSKISQKNETNVSNEFMLVLHPMKKSEEIGKQESFDLELEDALSPTPISLSVPDISFQKFDDIQMPPLRRSVSSTELLYERAMARFYEAVELEEAESRKRKLSEDKGSQSANRKRLGSFGHEERLSFERRPSLRRRLSGDVHLPLANTSNNEQEFKTHSIVKNKMETESVIENKAKLEGNVEYDSDYTESTATSSEDSIEKFKTELFVRTRSISGELETYHPRKMSEGNFSPYRPPTADQSAIVLNKPSPLANPDFIPKPILKRSSTENVIKDETSSGSQPKTNPDDEKLKESGFNFKNIFKKDKSLLNTQQGQTESISNKRENDKNRIIETSKNPEQNKSISETQINTNNLTMNPRFKTLEEAQTKKLELRQSSEEETKVVVEYYSDIVRELGSSRRQGIPLYMRGGDYSKSDEEAEKENKSEEKTEEELIAKAIERPRLSIVERLQSTHVQSKSKLAMEKPLLHRDNESEERNAINETKESDESDNLQHQKGPLTTIRKKERKTTGSPSVRESRSRSKTSKSNKNPAAVVQKRTTSHSRDRNESKSFTNFEILKEKKDEIYIVHSDVKTHQPELRPKTPEELIEEAQETVRSTMSYITDVGLFIVACWVYIFKDVRLVLPILALLVYRQAGEVLSNKIPDWMKRKKK